MYCHTRLSLVLPYALVVGVEDMRAVTVHVHALHVLGIDIAGDMLPLFHDQHALALRGRLLRENSAEQSRTDDQIIVFHIIILSENNGFVLFAQSIIA